MAIPQITDDYLMVALGRLARGKSRNGNGTFKFWIDDELDLSAPIRLGHIPSEVGEEVRCEYELKPVPADKPSYKLSYALFVENDEQVGEKQHYQIWPKQGAIVAKDEEDAPVTGFKFKVTQPPFDPEDGGTSTEDGGTSPEDEETPPEDEETPPEDGGTLYKERSDKIEGYGEDGEYKFDLHPGVEYAVEVLPPWSIVEWVKGTENSFSQKEVKVELNLTAEFIGPLGKTADGDPLEIYDEDAREKAAETPPILKQYVNLGTSEDGWDARGNKVLIEVAAKGDKAKEPEDQEGGGGLFVYFHMKFSGADGDESKSERSFPKTEPKAGANLSEDNITAVEDGKEYKGKVDLASRDKTDKFPTGKFEVELGCAGGDTCEIKISGTKDFQEDSPDATLKFINWRKLEYELLHPDIMTNLATVNEMKDIPEKVGEKVKERLGEVYVEYDLASSKQFTEENIAESKRYHFSDNEFLEGEDKNDKRFYMTDHLENHFGEEAFPVKFENPQPTNRMRVILAHQGFSCDSPVKQRTLSEEVTEPLAIFVEHYLLSKNPGDGADTLHIGQCRWFFCYKNGGDWTKDKCDPEDPAPLDFESSPVDFLSGSDQEEFWVQVAGIKSHTVQFKKSGADPVPAEVVESEKQKLKDFVVELNREGAKTIYYRGDNNKLKIKITGKISDAVRFNAVKAAVQESFDANFKICNQVGRDWDGNCFEGDIERDWISFTKSYVLVVDLPDDSADDPGGMLGDPDHAIRVEIKIDDCYGVNGWAGPNQQVLTIPGVANNDISDELAGAKSSTVCHELGHRMGMTIIEGRSNIPKDMPEAKHVDNDGDYYSNWAPEGKGLRDAHTGSHCAHGIADKSTADLIKTGDGADCIMYGSGGETDSRPAFCDTCKDYIKSRKLNNIIGDWNARTAEES